MSDNTPTPPKLNDDGYCFGCGPGNPIGLKLTFSWNDTTGDYETVYTPTREHQGWEGRIHGGLIAVVFDEVLSRVVLLKRGYKWVTAELTTRMIRPVNIGQTMHFKGRITLEKSRLTISQGEAFGGDGTLLASAHCKMMLVPPSQMAEMERTGGSG
ncbi:MAG TPA: PaaI family thioesterase [Capsulimonadaceae bacterium]|jgi:acyl-coenzyme A thioesterase PaaI-like protein